MEKLVRAIHRFNEMLVKLPDDIKFTYDFYHFFKTLPMVDHDSIPFVELGTILKYNKPNIYNDLKRYSDQSYVIEVITSMEMDLQQATIKIAKIIECNS